MTNKIIKTFSEFIPNNINIFGDLLSSNTDFFRVYIKQYTFSDKITANNVDYVQINYSEFIPNNFNIFGDLLSSNTDFFRVYIKQYTFSDKITANNVDHVQINYPKQSFRFRFILIILNNCTKFPSS